MSNTKTKKTPEELAGVVEDAPVTEAIPADENQEEKALAVARQEPLALGTYDIGGNPLNFEWVHMTYAVSKHNPDGSVPGEYYLGKNWEAKLTERGGSFDAVILVARTGYKDWPTGEYDPNFKAQVYANKAAAVAAGRRVDWADGPNGTRVKPDAAPFLQLFMLIKKTPTVEDDSLFSIPLDGEFYAPATMMFEKMNYQDAFAMINRSIQADAMRHIKEPGYKPTLLDRLFRIGSDEQKSKNTGNRFTRFTIRTAVEDGKPVLLSKEARADLTRLLELANQAMTATEVAVEE